MHQSFLITISSIFLLFAGPANANQCPNLSGFYWGIEGDKPRPGIGGRIMELVQDNCDSIAIFYHRTDENGNIKNLSENGFAWLLGSTPDECGHHISIDCRPHPFTRNSISTIGNGSLKRFPGTSSPESCAYTEFSWALDADGNITETTPVNCKDGSSEIRTRNLERKF